MEVNPQSLEEFTKLHKKILGVYKGYHFTHGDVKFFVKRLRIIRVTSKGAKQVSLASMALELFSDGGSMQSTPQKPTFPH